MTRPSESKKRGFYRSRNGMLLGVCRGIAEYFDVSVKWTRVIAVIIMIFTGFWPTVAVYFLAALLMKPEPILPLESDLEEEFYNSYTASRHMALQRLKRNFDSLDHRIQRMENIVTTKEFDWDRRLNS